LANAWARTTRTENSAQLADITKHHNHKIARFVSAALRIYFRHADTLVFPCVRHQSLLGIQAFYQRFVVVIHA
jgi:hypothetical protein